MKIIAFVLSVALYNPNPALQSGDYVIRKTPHALTVSSIVHGRTFMLGVVGDEVVLSKGSSKDHLAMTVDGRFLQVFSVAVTEFQGDARERDELILRQYMHDKARSYKVPLSEVRSETSKLRNGRTVLSWSFDPHVTPQIKQQLFVTLRWQTYVVVLGSAVQQGQNADELQQWLNRIAQSFRPEA